MPTLTAQETEFTILRVEAGDVDSGLDIDVYRTMVHAATRVPAVCLGLGLRVRSLPRFPEGTIGVARSEYGSPFWIDFTVAASVSAAVIAGVGSLALIVNRVTKSVVDISTAAKYDAEADEARSRAEKTRVEAFMLRMEMKELELTRALKRLEDADADVTGESTRIEALDIEVMKADQGAVSLDEVENRAKAAALTGSLSISDLALILRSELPPAGPSLPEWAVRRGAPLNDRGSLPDDIEAGKPDAVEVAAAIIDIVNAGLSVEIRKN